VHIDDTKLISLDSILIRWLQENLFRSRVDGLVTVVLVGLGLWLTVRFAEWAFIRSVWNANSLDECHQIVAAIHGEDQSGACWAVFGNYINLLLFGFYPEAQYWRPILAFFLLFAALAPIVFSSLPRKLLWFSAAYPIIAFVLIWGAFGLESVKSAKFGGFLMTIILGVAVATVIGIILALGRQYGIRSIKVLCAATTTLFNGIPIIVLLISAVYIGVYFFPPGFFIPIHGSVIFVLGMVGAAKVAEVFRQELDRITFGQFEAARALGLSADKTFWLVTLPLAYKRSIPQIALEAAIVFQNTTIVSIIGLLDPVGLTTPIRGGSVEWNGIMWELYFGIALAYWIFSFSIISYSKYHAQRLKREQANPANLIT